MSEAGTAVAAETEVKTGAAPVEGAALPTPVAETAAKGTGKAAESATPPAAGKEPATPEPPPTGHIWPEDWRERLAGDDETVLARLKRYQTLENYMRRTMDIEGKLRTGKLLPMLEASPTADDLAAYRKAWSIPDQATAEAYGIKFPDGHTVSDADTADVAEFVTDMHTNNVPPAVVQRVWAKYLGIQQKAREQLLKAAQLKTEENKAGIKSAYYTATGLFDETKFEREMGAADQFLVERLGEEKAKELTSITLADGTKLGDHPEFVRLYVRAAQDFETAAPMALGEGSGGASVEDRYQAALAVADTDPRKYHSPEHQATLMRLATARAKKAA